MFYMYVYMYVGMCMLCYWAYAEKIIDIYLWDSPINLGKLAKPKCLLTAFAYLFF